MTHRRRHVSKVVTTALTIGFLVAACGGDDTAAPDAASTTVASTGWSYTDDLGDAVELDEMPQRLVMFEDVAATLMDFGVRPVGIHYLNRVDGNRLFEGMETTGIESVGSTCEEVNVEAVAALEPDLIIYMHWGNEPDAAFCITPEQRALLQEIAPVVRLQAVGESREILASYEELAVALGADLTSSEHVARVERYDAATERLEHALADRPEISIIATSIAADWAGVAEPGGFADLVTLQERFGVQFAGPFSGEFSGEYWRQLSGETITDYRGDVILLDSKNETSLADKVDAFPLWGALPEVEADQIVPWFVPGSFSYTRDAVAMETLAEAIENAEDFVQDT